MSDTAVSRGGDPGSGFPRTIWIGHLQLAPIELGAALIGLLVFAVLGWDSPLWDGRLELLLHLLAILAVALAVVAVARGAALPITGIEAPILILLAAIGLATILGRNIGLAAPALAASLAFAAMLPIAVAAIRRQPALTALVITAPTLFLAVGTVWQLVDRRIGWFGIGVGGLPPVRVGNESTVFGSIAVPPFILLGLLPLCLMLEPRWLRVAMTVIAAVLLVPLAVLSGSRSAWLAIGAAFVVFATPWAVRVVRGRIRLGPGAWAAGLAALLVLGAASAYLAPRFTAITSLLYRERLWTDTLAAWSASPVLGLGPGTMPYARQAVAALGVGPTRQPHSHDLALGVLGDGGLLGLAAALLLVVVFLWIAGPHRSRTLVGRAAASVLVGYLAAGLFEDLTFLPSFDLIAIVLAAVALSDAGRVRWRPLPPLPRRWRAGLVAAIVIGALAVLAVAGPADAAAAAFRFGSDEAYAQRWSSATGWYQLSVALNPLHPAGTKALAVAADAAGDDATAIAALRTATSLNPGDGANWTNLAILCMQAGDRECAAAAAAESVRYSGYTGRELINAALVENWLGDDARADELYRLSLLTNLNTSIAIAWPREVRLDAGWLPDATDASTQLTVLLAEAATGSPIRIRSSDAPVVRAVALAIDGKEAAARLALDEAMAHAPFDVLTWDVAAALERHWEDPPAERAKAMLAAALLRGGPLSFTTGGVAPVTYEIASLRIYPRDMLVALAQRLIPAPPWPWALERFLPASRSPAAAAG